MVTSRRLEWTGRTIEEQPRMTSTAERARRRSSSPGAGAAGRVRTLLRPAMAVTAFAARRPVLTAVALALIVRVGAAVALALHGGFTPPPPGAEVGTPPHPTGGRGAPAGGPGHGPP